MDWKTGPRNDWPSARSSRPMSRRHSEAPVSSWRRQARKTGLIPKPKGLNVWALGVSAVAGACDITSPLRPVFADYKLFSCRSVLTMLTILAKESCQSRSRRPSSNYQKIRLHLRVHYPKKNSMKALYKRLTFLLGLLGPRGFPQVFNA
jgi:hypothetical protein